VSIYHILYILTYVITTNKPLWVVAEDVSVR
jgi:hypothetical protein